MYGQARRVYGRLCDSRVYASRDGVAGKRDYPPRAAVRAPAVLCCTAVPSRLKRRTGAAQAALRSPMNAPDSAQTTSPLPRDAAPHGAPRLREIPYNYTSFSDREIVHPPARRARLGAAEPAARGAPHRPLGAHAVRGAGRHLGGAAQPLPAGRPARQPEAPRSCWSRPCTTAWARSRSAARPSADAAARRAASASCWQPPARAVRALRRAASTRWPTCAAAPRSVLGRVHRQGQHQVRRPVARLARDRRHRLARRVPVRRAHARHRGRDGRPGQGLHRARPDHHPARRRHRLHRRRDAADLEERGHQHREARGHDRGRDGRAARPGPSRWPPSGPKPAW